MTRQQAIKHVMEKFPEVSDVLTVYNLATAYLDGHIHAVRSITEDVKNMNKGEKDSPTAELSGESKE